MDANELLSIIAKVRRAQPRNMDVLAICDVAEQSVIKKPSSLPAEPVVPRPALEQPKFDRKAYQRELMRKRRAEGKA